MIAKKGDLPSVLIIMVLVIVAGVVFVLLGSVNNSILNDLSNESDITAQAQQTATESANNVIPIADNFIFWFFFAGMLGLIIASIYLDFHPAVIIVFIVVLLIGVWGATQASNIYGELSDDGGVDTSGFTLTSAIFGSYMPFIIFGVLIIVGIILYGKSRGGQTW